MPAEGDHIKVTASPYPFPTVCADKQSTDWFHSIARTLKWNERQRQKSFVILEEGRKKPRSSSSAPNKAGPAPAASDPAPKKKQTSFAPDPVQAPAAVAEDDEDDDEDDEEDEDEEGDDTEEEYDIDDVSESTTNASSPSLVASDAPQHGLRHTASSSSSSNLPPLIHAHAEPSGSPALVSHSHATGHPISAQDLVDMSSNASSISVDIQDDPTERYATQPPRSRGRSRSRGRTTLQDARRASKGAQESDADQSEDRAFAVVGHDEDDEDDSSQVRPLSLRASRGPSSRQTLTLALPNLVQQSVSDQE